MKADLAKLRALHEAATPGKFTLSRGTNVMAADGYSATNVQSNLFDSNARNEANAALIVAAVNALPDLIAEITHLRATAEAVERAPECEWTQDEIDETWDSACGEKWQFTDGGPAENSVRFCHGCGQRVRLLAIGEDG